MIRRTAVVDTNVVVSGILTPRPESPTARILRAMIAAEFPFLLSVALLAEYRKVLLRRPIRETHRRTEDAIDKVLIDIALNGIVVEPAPTISSPPDRGDQHLWDLLAARPEAVLVTGDARLLRSPPEGTSALSPRSFVGLATRR